MSKIKDLNQTLIKKVQKLKQGKSSKGKWEKNKSNEELKKKEIGILRNHNKKLLDEFKILKEEKKHDQNQEKTKILDEETTKGLEDEIYKKVEESLNIDEVKL
jgi:hypothetical protein